MGRRFLRLPRGNKGQGLVEYALLVAGVALVAVVGVSVLGSKTSDLIATVAAVMPGAQPADNGPIQSGSLLETTQDSNGTIVLNLTAILANSGTSRLGNNLGVGSLADLVK